MAKKSVRNRRKLSRKLSMESTSTLESMASGLRSMSARKGHHRLAALVEAEICKRRECAHTTRFYDGGKVVCGDCGEFWFAGRAR